MNNYLFTEQESQDIFSEEISVKRHKELVQKANQRFVYIVGVIEEVIGRKQDWFDFANEYMNDNDPVPGYFDKDLYRNEISYVGSKSLTRNENFNKYDNSFPTEWLWINFEEDLKNEVKIFSLSEKEKLDNKKANEAAKKEAIKKLEVQLPTLKASVYNKTPHEILDNLNFKTSAQIYYENSLDEKHKALKEIKDTINQQREELRKILTPEEFNAVDFKTPEKIYHEYQIKQNHKKVKIK